MNTYFNPEKIYWENNSIYSPASNHGRAKKITWSDRVECLPLDALASPVSEKEKKIGFIGFCSHEGVRRNNGREGAADGPAALRNACARLEWKEEEKELYDVGDIRCLDRDLESAQKDLGILVSKIIGSGIFPFAFGGGHEVALGTFKGIWQQYKGKKIGIVNLDAHLDIRDPRAGGFLVPGSNSGTPFFEIEKICRQAESEFNYLCLGLRRESNSQELWDRSRTFKVQTVLKEEMSSESFGSVRKKIGEFLQEMEVIYLTLCLDVLDESVAPGVSAANKQGLFPETVFVVIRQVLESKKVVAADIAELCPRLDVGEKTAKLAAQFVQTVVLGL